MEAKLVIGSSTENMDLYWATKFLTTIPFYYIETGRKSYMMIPDVEVEKAKRMARVGRVVSLQEYSEQLKRETENPTGLDCLNRLIKELKITELTVPANLGIKVGDYLRSKGYRLQVKENPFFEERMIKTKEEIEYITEALRGAEKAMDDAVVVLKESRIKGRLLYHDNKVLTSEDLKRIIENSLWQNGCLANNTIVACGNDAVEPHNEGSGPLRANETIVIDIFPQSKRTLYWGDMTRTFVKGRATNEQKRMYDTVLNALNHAVGLVRDGVDGKDVHQAVHKYFDKQVYKTCKVDGKLQGFVHGTGHGIGLEIHEYPGLTGMAENNTILKSGNVVAIEPGLYYHDRGCVRLEDMIVVTKNSCRNITKYPKILELE